jgi:hypothetical protein
MGRNLGINMNAPQLISGLEQRTSLVVMPGKTLLWGHLHLESQALPSVPKALQNIVPSPSPVQYLKAHEM